MKRPAFGYVLAISAMATSIAPAVASASSKAAAPAAPDPSAPGLSIAEQATIDAIFKPFDKPDSAGCALGVIRHGRMIYARGYGMADIERGVPITPATLFDIGSTSKQFAAATIILLALDGKLSLTDDVRKYVPELPDFGSPITINNLLNHTSGMRDYAGLFALAGYSIEDITTEAQALDLLSRQRALNAPPGSRYEYSNTGYFLATIIVQRVSGKSFNTFARERIFAPLGMNKARFRDNHAALIPDRALGYAPDGKGGFVNHMSNWEPVGDGALHVSVEEMLHWEGNFIDPRVGGPALLQQLQQRGKLASGKEIIYSRGLFVDTYRGQPHVSHGGAWMGYRATFERFPRQETAIAVFCNADSAEPATLSQHVADIILANVLAPVVVGTGMPSGKIKPVKSLPLTQFTGEYWDAEARAMYHVTEKDGGLFLSFEDSVLPLIATGPGRFAVNGYPVTVSFALVKGEGRRLNLKIGSSDEISATHYVPPSVDLAMMQSYAGSYYSPETGGIFSFVIRDGKLTFESDRPIFKESVGPLEPVMIDFFSGRIGFLKFQRSATGKVAALLLTTERMKDVAFVKRE